jgi:nitrogenase subunit NifH
MRSLSSASLTSKISLGNLGFSSPLCSTVSFGVGHNVIACPYGTVKKIFSFGIHPKRDDKKTLEDEEEIITILNIFKPRSKGIRCLNNQTDVCNRYINHT